MSFVSRWSFDSYSISHGQSWNRGRSVVLRNAGLCPMYAMISYKISHSVPVTLLLHFSSFPFKKQVRIRWRPTSLPIGTEKSHFSLSTPPDEVRASVEYAVATPAIPRVEGVYTSSGDDDGGGDGGEVKEKETRMTMNNE